MKNGNPINIKGCYLRLGFFLIVWIAVWITYKDVLYELQLQNFWVPGDDYTTITKDQNLLSYISHAAMTVFAMPFLGAMVIAVGASVLELLSYAVVRRSEVSCIPSIIFLFILFSYDSGIYITNDNAFVFEFLFIAIATLAILALIRLPFGFRQSTQHPIFTAATVIIMLAGSIIYGYRDTQFREITGIRYQLSHGQLEKAAKLAERSDHPTRTLAAYHAIAIADMGQLGDRLFNMRHDYKSTKSLSIHMPDFALRSGLVLSAYHLCMEQMVIYGITKDRLEFMTRCAVILKEHNLADKYRHILSKIPFEKAFLDDISKMDISKISALMPKKEAFEQNYGKNFILNYLAGIGEEATAEISATACLYMKNIEMFKRYLPFYKGKRMPKCFQQSLIMLSKETGNDLLKQFNIEVDVLNEVNRFTSTLIEHQNDTAAFEKFRRTIMYYDFFE